VINTNPATLRSGTVWFQIDTSAPTGTGNTELNDMSSLKYEFDLKSSESIVNTYGIIPGSMSIKVVDKTEDGRRVYNALSFLLPFQTSALDAKMFYLKHGETSPKTFPFQIKATGISYDVKTDTTAIELLPRIQSSNTVNTFLDSLPYGSRNILNKEFVTIDKEFNGFFAGDVIEGFIAELDTSPGNMNVYLSGQTTPGTTFAKPGFGRTVDYENGGTNAYLGNVVYGFADLRAEYPSSGEQSIRSKVISMSAMEGAVFGSAFSINFYVNRLRTDDNVTLTNNDISDIRSVFGSGQVNATNTLITPYQSGDSAFKTTFVPTGAQVAGNPIGDQFVGINLVAHSPQFCAGILDFDATNSPPQYINCTESQLNTLVSTNVQGIATAGATAYSYAFDASFIIPTRVETTILGVDKLKPYQALKFDDSTPSEYQGKHYRPTSVEYDFKQDTIKVTAYKIP
jgi:hypothetical protein